VPFPGFELACVAIVALTLAAMARLRPWRALLADYAALAVAGWLGEETCVAWYRFYGYAPAWHGRLDHVPVLIPLIWPLVILSARAVTDAIAPRAGWWRPLLVGALVVFDASLVEVIAVRAGLWGWAEGGHLGVPLVGILGWGFFAACADVALGLRARARHLALILAVAVTHLLIVVAWWGCFRWTLRGPLGDASLVGLAAAALLAIAGAWLVRRHGRALSLDIALPRMVAATLFLITLAVVAPREARLWLHAALVAAPYLAVTSFRRPGTPRSEIDVDGQPRLAPERRTDEEQH
jgi:hypothetical protein